MHDKALCRDFFHQNIMKPFISNIMQSKGHDIKYMNQILKGMKTDKQKRKLPERKDKCDICGRFFLNQTGLNLHKKRMHATKLPKTVNIMSLTRSDSVSSSRSVKSVTSPPPKKIQQDIKPEDTELPKDNTEIITDNQGNINDGNDIYIDIKDDNVEASNIIKNTLPIKDPIILVKNYPEPEAQNRQAGPTPKPNTGGEGISEPELKQAEHTLKPKTGRDDIKNNIQMEREEDIRLAKIEIVDLKTCVQTQNEQIRKLKESHVLEIKEVVLKHDRLNKEYQNALKEISKLEKEKGLLKAREDVMRSFDE